jgi:hypothetical protein
MSKKSDNFQAKNVKWGNNKLGEYIIVNILQKK